MLAPTVKQKTKSIATPPPTKAKMPVAKVRVPCDFKPDPKRSRAWNTQRRRWMNRKITKGLLPATFLEIQGSPIPGNPSEAFLRRKARRLAKHPLNKERRAIEEARRKKMQELNEALAKAEFNDANDEPSQRHRRRAVNLQNGGGAQGARPKGQHHQARPTLGPKKFTPKKQ